MEKILELMQCSYTWPGMPALVKDYVSRCDRCTRFKESNQAPPGKLKLLDTPPGSWKEISADFIMDLPESEGFDSILVVVNQFSKKVEFIPCTKSMSALDTTNCTCAMYGNTMDYPRELFRTEDHNSHHK